MKKIILFTIFHFLFHFSFSQNNEISNGGFEDGSPLPLVLSQAGNLNNWENQNFNGYHSPDWFYKYSFDHHYGDPLLGYGPHQGNGYIGITNYELIQQQVNLISGKIYYFSCYVQLSDYDGSAGASPLYNFDQSSLNVYLSVQKIKYECDISPSHLSNDCSSNECLSTYVDKQNGVAQIQDIITIKNFQLSKVDMPFGSGWHLLQCYFEAPEPINYGPFIHDHYNWLSIELVNNAIPNYNFSNGFCHEAYLLIDDVLLTDLCNSFCANNLPPIDYWYHTSGGNVHYDIVTSMVGNLNTTFHLFIENAQRVKFTVWNQWGADIYDYESYDPNGLKNPGYSDFLFIWNGLLNNGTTYPGSDNFVINMKIESCVGNNVDYTGSLYYEPPPNDQDAWGIPEIKNLDLEPCCPVFQIIDNVNYSSDITVSAQDYIQSGVNGPVTSSGSGWPHTKVKYHAGNDIILGPQFNLDVSTDFEAVLIPCGYRQMPEISRLDSMPFVSVLNNFNLVLKIFPNPNSGYFSIRFSDAKTYLIEVYNSLGLKVLSNTQSPTLSGHLVQLNLSKYGKGIYLVKVREGDKESSSKVVVE